jgi:hypothetical protein
MDKERALTREEVAAAIKRAQELVARHVLPGVSLVEELLADRRREAGMTQRRKKPPPE